MTVSFSISSKPSSSSSRPNPTETPQSFTPAPQQANGGGGAVEDGQPQLQFVTVCAPSKTLAPVASTRHVISPLPNADFLRPLKKMKSHFVLDTSAAEPAVRYGLCLRSRDGGAGPNPQDQERDRGRRFEPAESLILRRFHEDMRNLPDDRGFSEFADVPVEGFAAALLAGYGWSEGKGIGRTNKEDTKIFELERRAGTAGLGYTPSPDDPKASKRKGQGLPHEKKPAVDSEKIVRVISGRHAGQKGKVVKMSEGSGIALKLLRSGDEVTVEEDMVAELGSAKEEKCLNKLKELEIHGRDGKKSWSVGVPWLMSRIMVRIISKDFKDGKLYKKKGEVVDVVAPTTCVVSMDESKELVEDVDQEILETVLPKHGGSVLVLYGEHKGVFGSLVERNMEEETGLVRDADSHALINVRLDQIAEYLGDPSDLGY